MMIYFDNTKKYSIKCKWISSLISLKTKKVFFSSSFLSKHYNIELIRISISDTWNQSKLVFNSHFINSVFFFWFSISHFIFVNFWEIKFATVLFSIRWEFLSLFFFNQNLQFISGWQLENFLFSLFFLFFFIVEQIFSPCLS